MITLSQPTRLASTCILSLKNSFGKLVGICFICFWLVYISSQAFALDLSGVVFHDDGVTPFAGARVYATSPNKYRNYYGYYEPVNYHGPVQTDSLGRYTLTNLPAMTDLTVRVFAPKMYPEQWIYDDSKSDEKNQHNFILTPAPVLAGRVLSSGPSVKKLYFYFFREEHLEIRGDVDVQPDGEYLIVLASSSEYEIDGKKATEQLNQRSFRWPLTGEKVAQLPKMLSYSLQVGASGYEQIFYPNLTVQRGEVTYLDISPKPATGSLSGRVVDSAGLPIEGVAVIRPNPEFIGTLTAISDKQGNFVISNVPAGTYFIDLLPSYETIGDKPPEYAIVDRVQVSIAEGEEYNRLKIVVKPTSDIWVSGHIFSADGKTLLNERFVPYHFWAHKDSEEIESDGGFLRLDNQERYRRMFQGKGIYWLTLFHRGNPITQQFEANRGDRILDLDYAMKLLPDEELRVIGKAIEETTGKPIPNLPLIIQTLPSGFWIPLFTDDQGIFKLDRFPPEDKRLKVSFTAYRDYPYPYVRHSEQEGVEVEVIDGKAHDILVLLKRSVGANVAFKITSKHTGEPIEARVEGLPGPSGQVFGYGVFRDIPPGVYQIYVSTIGYQSQEHTIEVKPETDMELAYQLEPLSTPKVSVSGRVEWLDGKPVEQAKVWISQIYSISGRSYFSQRGIQKIFFSRADGTFEFDNLLPGNCEIRLKVPGTPTQKHNIKIDENGLRGLVLRLKRGTQVRGRLVFEDGVPYPKGPVLVLDSGRIGMGVRRIQGVYRPLIMLKQDPLDFPYYMAKFSEGDKFAFVFDRVLPGEYWISFWDDGPRDGSGWAMPLIAPLKIAVKDEEDQFIEIRVEKMGQLVGQIFNKHTNAPIAQARVSVYGNSLQRLAYTDHDGYYQLELPMGKYQIQVNSPDQSLKATMEEIQVIRSEATKVDVYLTE